MSGYETRYAIVSHNGQEVSLQMCTDCGVPVLDKDKHDEFHENLSRKIRHAGRNAGLLDRIG